MVWVKFHDKLCRGAKRGLPRAARFVFMELCLEARPGRGVIALPLGMSALDALHDVLGGNRKEIADAIKALTTVPKHSPDDPEPRAMVEIGGEDGALTLTIPSWEAHAAPLTQAWDTSAYPEVYARDGWTCRYCGAADLLSIDHVIPRCQGGDDSTDNLVVACRPCNSRKNGRTPQQAGMVLRPIGGA